jgi:hypothetical protein
MDKRRRKLRIAAALLAMLAVWVGVTVWAKLYQDVAQPKSITGSQPADFLYGSIGTERAAGMPYWVWLVLPRICPDSVGAQGGYAALDRPWDQGRELPAGFAKKTIGYVRVGGNCALCHSTLRPGPDGMPVVAVAGPGETRDTRKLLAFYASCVQDPRFNADEILSEIGMVTKLSVLDQLLYRFVLIPRTRQAILDRRAVMIDPELLRHSRDPRAPFSTRQRNDLAAWLVANEAGAGLVGKASAVTSGPPPR